MRIGNIHGLRYHGTFLTLSLWLGSAVSLGTLPLSDRAPGSSPSAATTGPRIEAEPIGVTPLPPQGSLVLAKSREDMETVDRAIESSNFVRTDAQRPVLVAVLYTRVATCIVGDPCTGVCTEISRPDGTTVASFEYNDNYRSLQPSDPEIANYPNRVCLELDLDGEEIREARAALTHFRAAVLTASGGRMDPRIVVKKIPRAELALGRFFNGFWIDPWTARDTAAHLIGPGVDGLLVTGGTLDHTQNVRLPIAACGLTFGADFGLGGAGFSWIPWSNGYFFQCDAFGTNFHEWLHQVDYASETIMQIPDIYAGGFPACGLSDPDSHRWFPSADTCTSDPDWQDCGSASCPDTDVWNDHVLSSHFDFSNVYIGNHCRDGRQDFDETGIDTGGSCQ